ncbi:DUF3318 domain-containing protein [Acaryochloris thomasi]|nr:DUF3318 domain-containing protein [Acaryochloris thomasi]
MVSSSNSSVRTEMNELRRLRSLLPPELQSWVTVEATTAINPPLITSEELGQDQVEVQVDLIRWEEFAKDQRNLLFWHEVARIQNDTIPRDGWEMAALAIGLGGAVGELWVQDGLLLILAMALCGVSGWRLYKRNNSQQSLDNVTAADEKAIALATRFGYSLPNAYKSLGSALKVLIDQTPNRRKRKQFEARLQALKTGAAEAKARSKAMRTEREGRSQGKERPQSKERPPIKETIKETVKESRPYTP